MQNTQNATSAEYVVNIVKNYIKQARGFSSIYSFYPALAVLYAMHKGYKIRLLDNIFLEFLPKDEDQLYNDLSNLVPREDVHLHRALSKFVKELSAIDREELNSVYVDVLRGLFDFISSNSGKQGEFYTPSAITKLMAYIVNKEQCNEVYDPFCGTASIIHELSNNGKLPQFVGQEFDHSISIYARLNAEALYGYDNCIILGNSITKWDNRSYDAVVSCPPLGLRLTNAQLLEAKDSTPECPCESFEDIILTRPFYSNNARLTVTHLPMSFCFKGSRDYELRRNLVEQNLVDTIIALPSGILYGTSIPSIIMVCKKGRGQNEHIKFIQTEEYYQGEHRNKTFDYARFIKMIEGDERDVVKVTPQEVRSYDYNLNPSLYHKMDYSLGAGQKLVRLADILTLIEGERISATDVREMVSYNNLSRDFIGVLLNNGKKVPPKGIQNAIYHRFKAAGGKYLLSYSTALESRYGINTDGEDFVCPANVKVFKINEHLVCPEYLAYTLINHEAISKGNMPLSGCMMLPIVVDSLENQKELVNKEIQQYEQKVYTEREADAKRLGIKQNVSDLEHMLGSTQLRINKIIARLEKATPSSENYQHLIKSMKDNVEYLNRIIHYNNARIESESFNMREGDISEFINNYADAWNNYGGEYFELVVQNSINDNVKMSYDRTLLTVMLDSILNNAIRHGFHKRKNYTEHNTVQINLSVVEYNSLPYVLLSVANNGDSLAEGYNINDYVSRGRYSASTGRSGLGGYHVYQIAKGHNGFLNLDSNKVWNMIVEVLLPIKSTSFNDIPVYDKECI